MLFLSGRHAKLKYELLLNLHMFFATQPRAAPYVCLCYAAYCLFFSYSQHGSQHLFFSLIWAATQQLKLHPSTKKSPLSLLRCLQPPSPPRSGYLCQHTMSYSILTTSSHLLAPIPWTTRRMGLHPPTEVPEPGCSRPELLAAKCAVPYRLPAVHPCCVHHPGLPPA